MDAGALGAAGAGDCGPCVSEDGAMRVMVADDSTENIVGRYYGSKAMTSRNNSVRKRKGILPEEAADPPPSCQKSEWEGPFWFEAPRTIIVRDPKTGHPQLRRKGIASQERQRLRELLKTGFITEEFLRTVVVPTNDETSHTARLRAHDFALTNWLKGRPLLKQIKRADGVTELTDIAVDYDQQLDRDHRKLFDPFRRGTHLFYELDNHIHHTTVGQLSLLQFELRNDVTGCVEEHEEEIRKLMKEAAKAKPDTAVDGKRRRRRELTRNPSKYSRGAVLADYDIITSTREEVEAEEAATRALFAKNLGKSAMARASAERAFAERASTLASADASSALGASGASGASGAVEAHEVSSACKRRRMEEGMFDSLPVGALS